MTPEQKQQFAETLHTLSVRGLSIALGIVGSVITARYLGAEDRGNFFYWSYIAALIVQFGNFGLHASNIYLLANSNSIPGTLLSNSTLVALVVCALGPPIVALPLVMTTSATLGPWSYIALSGLVFSGLYLLLGSNLLLGLSQVVAFNKIEIWNKSLIFIFLASATITFGSWEISLLAVSGAGILTCLMLRSSLRTFVTPARSDLSVLRLAAPYGARAYIVAALSFLALKLNVFLLGSSASSLDFGVWSITAQITEYIVVLPSTVALILLPRIMNAGDKGALLWPTFWVTLLAVGAVSIFVLGFGKPLILFLYGDEFIGAYRYLVLSLPCITMIALMTVLSQYLAAIGIPVWNILIWAGVILLNFIFFNFAHKQFGIEGAIGVQSISFFLGFIAMLALVLRSFQQVEIKTGNEKIIC